MPKQLPNMIETWTGVARKLSKSGDDGHTLYMPKDWVHLACYEDSNGDRWVMWRIEGDLEVQLRPLTAEEKEEIDEEIRKRHDATELS